jgi:LysR family transcriptional activator of nhaA
MEWLNYHHLFYFWVVAREGTIARAATELRVTRPTISAQIRSLEDTLGERLFERRGRRLALTDAGRLAARYAEEIFALGRELPAMLQGSRIGARPLRLVVGASDVLPKAIVHRLLQPALELDVPVRLVVREDRPVEDFVGELAVHSVDLVLADGPVGPYPVRAFNHLLGECGTTFFAVDRLASSRRGRFPKSLHGAPLLLPGLRSSLRRAIDEWLARRGIVPDVRADLDDTALVEVFGEHGRGIFAGPSVIESEIRARRGVKIVGRVPELRQQFYAITVERRHQHPAVAAVCAAPRHDVFGRR